MTISQGSIGLRNSLSTITLTRSSHIFIKWSEALYQNLCPKRGRLSMGNFHRGLLPAWLIDFARKIKFEKDIKNTITLWIKLSWTFYLKDVGNLQLSAITGISITSRTEYLETLKLSGLLLKAREADVVYTPLLWLMAWLLLVKARVSVIFLLANSRQSIPKIRLNVTQLIPNVMIIVMHHSAASVLTWKLSFVLWNPWTWIKAMGLTVFHPYFWEIVPLILLCLYA